MSLRKLSMVIFLNEVSTGAEAGKLRLHTKGEKAEGVIDISTRLGRAVMFKSEEMMHKVISSLDQDDYTLTFYFT